MDVKCRRMDVKLMCKTRKRKSACGERSPEYKYRRKIWEECVPAAATSSGYNMVGLAGTPIISVKIDPELDTTKMPFEKYETDLKSATVVSVKIEPDLDTTRTDTCEAELPMNRVKKQPGIDRIMMTGHETEGFTTEGGREMIRIKVEPELDVDLTSYPEYGPSSAAQIVYPVKIESEVDADAINADYGMDFSGAAMIPVKIKPDVDTVSLPSLTWTRQRTPVSADLGKGSNRTGAGHARECISRRKPLDGGGNACENGTKRKREYKSRKDTAKVHSSSVNQVETNAELTAVALPTKIVTEPIVLENKSAADIIREYGPRIKAMWNASKLAAKKPPAKSSAERMREYRAWIKSLGEAGDPIAKLMAERAAEYTRKRRERIKALAEAGDPAALAVVKRATEYPRERRARIKALAAAGDPAAAAMVKRATEYPRKRRARIKALAEAGDPTAKTMARREAECMRKYRARKRELREAGDPAATAAAKRMTEYYREYRARRKAMREAGELTSAIVGKSPTEYARKRRARIKALAEAGDTAAIAKAKRMTEYYRAYRARKRALREAGDPAAVAAAKRTAEYYREYRARKKSLSENVHSDSNESPSSDGQYAK